MKVKRFLQLFSNFFGNFWNLSISLFPIRQAHSAFEQLAYNITTLCISQLFFATFFTKFLSFFVFFADPLSIVFYRGLWYNRYDSGIFRGGEKWKYCASFFVFLPALACLPAFRREFSAVGRGLWSARLRRAVSPRECSFSKTNRNRGKRNRILWTIPKQTIGIGKNEPRARTIIYKGENCRFRS